MRLALRVQESNEYLAALMMSCLIGARLRNPGKRAEALPVTAPGCVFADADHCCRERRARLTHGGHGLMVLRGLSRR
ncbi:hypothetical protein GCM10023086_75550 [Streptomyces venetus]|uniref:Uncharacterized protein n=1 Tax=Streptomyces venetus TaxID=1701086 RepID=A0ABP8HJU7_9ACTN